MKPTALLLLIVLPLLVLSGCTSVSSDGGGETKDETETEPTSEMHLDLIGLSYYWISGLMVEINYNYFILKDSTDTYLSHAEIDSEDHIMDKEILQEESDTTMQMVNDNYVVETNAESEGTGDEYELLEADSSGTKEETKTELVSEMQFELIGLSYYWISGSMARMSYNYSISKDPAGTYLFHAEIESEDRIMDKEISQEEFDNIMQIVNDNYVAETDLESEDAGDEYELLDADSSGFEVIFADGQTQSINLGQAGNVVLSQLKKLLEESSTK